MVKENWNALLQCDREKTSFACFVRAFFIFVHFGAFLVLPTI